MAERFKQQNDQKNCVEEDEGKEVLVIAVTQAIVYERTMMVKVLNTLVADGTVERCLGLDHLAVRA